MCDGISEDEFRDKISISEIQRYEGNCWAATLSMTLRCHGFDVSQQEVTSLFHEWRFEGVTAAQMAELVKFYNRSTLARKGWIMKTTDHFGPLLTFLNQFAPVQVFIDGHFVLVLSYDAVTDNITFFDPWDGSVKEVSQATFNSYGGGETVYMYRE